MEKFKLKQVFSEKEIRERVMELAKQIERDYTDDEPILCVCVLRGAVMFFTDLVKEMRTKNIMFDFISLSSYNAQNTTGSVRLISDMREKVEGKHLLIVEDIVDSGYTLEFLRGFFKSKKALSVKTVCLLDKPMGRQIVIESDYVAFTLRNDSFIVGYGLDCDQLYRNLDGIYEVVKD